MRSMLAWGYGLFAYLASVVSLGYFIGFILNILTPTSLNTVGSAPSSITWLIDLCLIALFGLQHSVMARPSFKVWLKRYVPQYLERSTYLLATSIVLAILIVFWQPIPGQFWRFEDGLGADVLTGIALGGWGLALFSTFLISHFDLFGLRQVYLYTRGRTYAPVVFEAPLLYRWVRHPMQLGALIGIWFSPDMSANHLLLAVGMTIYIFIGLTYEERDLMKEFGDRYRVYRQNTPMLIPFLKSKARAE